MRLFFGLEVRAPWPEVFPEGRLLAEPSRHLTLAFLGNADLEALLNRLKNFSSPHLPAGLCGHFDMPLFLPNHHPSVVSWNVNWGSDAKLFADFYQNFIEWLEAEELYKETDQRGFLSHVTIARTPFLRSSWEQAFIPLPIIVGDLILYESMGNLVYEPRWRCPIPQPFEEIEHTADIAFTIRGSALEQIYHHAKVALAAHFPPLLDYFYPLELIDSIDSIIYALNKTITNADQEVSCPFKAISYHDRIKKESNIMEWEMIVDV